MRCNRGWRNVVSRNGGLLAGASAAATGTTDPGALAAASFIGGSVSSVGAGVPAVLGVEGGAAVLTGVGLNFSGGFTGDAFAQLIENGNVDFEMATAAGGTTALGYLAGGTFAADALAVDSLSASGTALQAVTSLNGAIISTGATLAIDRVSAQAKGNQ